MVDGTVLDVGGHLSYWSRASLMTEHVRDISTGVVLRLDLLDALDGEGGRVGDWNR